MSLSARISTVCLLSLSVACLHPVGAVGQGSTARLIAEVTAEVEANRKLTQVMVDKIFSFSELGFQEVETSHYLVGLLRANGFTVEEGISGVPTAWVARWGSGGPVIALGSDIDGIPKASQKPGVAFHDPIVEGAPGHGEGHNSGQALNVTAALALRKIMEREGIEDPTRPFAQILLARRLGRGFNLLVSPSWVRDTCSSSRTSSAWRTASKPASPSSTTTWSTSRCRCR